MPLSVTPRDNGPRIAGLAYPPVVPVWSTSPQPSPPHLATPCLRPPGVIPSELRMLRGEALSLLLHALQCPERTVLAILLRVPHRVVIAVALQRPARVLSGAERTWSTTIAPIRHSTSSVPRIPPMAPRGLDRMLTAAAYNMLSPFARRHHGHKDANNFHSSPDLMTIIRRTLDARTLTLQLPAGSTPTDEAVRDVNNDILVLAPACCTKFINDMML